MTEAGTKSGGGAPPGMCGTADPYGRLCCKLLCTGKAVQARNASGIDIGSIEQLSRLYSYVRLCRSAAHLSYHNQVRRRSASVSCPRLVGDDEIITPRTDHRGMLFSMPKLNRAAYGEHQSARRSRCKSGAQVVADPSRGRE